MQTMLPKLPGPAHDAKAASAAGGLFSSEALPEVAGLNLGKWR